MRKQKKKNIPKYEISHACNQKKNHGGNPSSHGPIRTWGQEPEQGEHHQQNGFTLKFNRTMIQRLFMKFKTNFGFFSESLQGSSIESSGIVQDEPFIEV